MSDKKRRKRVVFKLTDVQRKQLERISVSRTERHARVMRSKFILEFADHNSIQQIANRYQVHRIKVERTLDKVEMVGPIEALDDLKGRGKKEVISDPAKIWMLHIACTSPQELGFPYEIWSYEKLAKYLRDNCIEKGYPSLKKIQKGTICKLIKKTNLKPFKVKYYLESKDPNFEEKMTQVLLLYKKVKLQLEKQEEEKESNLISPVKTSPQKQEWTVVSYDEKPGVQCTETKGQTNFPLSCKGTNTHISRDYEYIRHGTLSLLSGIDLLNGHVHREVNIISDNLLRTTFRNILLL